MARVDQMTGQDTAQCEFAARSRDGGEWQMAALSLSLSLTFHIVPLAAVIASSPATAPIDVSSGQHV